MLLLLRERRHNSGQALNHREARAILAMKHGVANVVPAPVSDRQNVVVLFDVGCLLAGNEKGRGPERQPPPRRTLALARDHRACINDIGSKDRARRNLEGSGSRDQLGNFDPFGADDQIHGHDVFESVDPIQVPNLDSSRIEPAVSSLIDNRQAAPDASFCIGAIRALAFLAIDWAHNL